MNEQATCEIGTNSNESISTEEIADSYHENGNINEFTILQNGEVVGFGHCSLSGKKEYDLNWGGKNGVAIHRYFNDDGCLTMREEIDFLQNDDFKETRTHYFTNGNPYIEVDFLNDIENGFEKCWYQSGRLKFISSWSNGKRNGSYDEWNEKGQKTIQGVWKNNKETDTWTFLDEQNNEYGQEVYRCGSVISSGQHVNKYMQNQHKKEVFA